MALLAPLVVDEAGAFGRLSILPLVAVIGNTDLELEWILALPPFEGNEDRNEDVEEHVEKVENLAKKQIRNRGYVVNSRALSSFNDLDGAIDFQAANENIEVQVDFCESSDPRFGPIRVALSGQQDIPHVHDCHSEESDLEAEESRCV